MVGVQTGHYVYWVFDYLTCSFNSLRVHGISPLGWRTPTVTGVRIHPLGNVNSNVCNNLPMITLASIYMWRYIVCIAMKISYRMDNYIMHEASFAYNSKMVSNAFSVTNAKGKEHKWTWSERSKSRIIHDNKNSVLWYIVKHALIKAYFSLSGSNLLGSNSIGLSKYCVIRHMTDDAICVQ